MPAITELNLEVLNGLRVWIRVAYGVDAQPGGLLRYYFRDRAISSSSEPHQMPTASPRRVLPEKSPFIMS